MGCFEPVTCTVLHVHVHAHDVHVHEYPWMVIAGNHAWDVTPVFLCPSRNSPLDFREHRDLHRPCLCLVRSVDRFFCRTAISAAESAETRGFSCADFSWLWLAPGSARRPSCSTEIWNANVGCPLLWSCNLQKAKHASDFCFPSPQGSVGCEILICVFCDLLTNTEF